MWDPSTALNTGADDPRARRRLILLAIVLAMDWCINKKQALPIYSDSASAISWVKAGKCNTKLERLPSNRLLFDLLGRAEEALKTYPAFKVLKWDTRAWGEIPADFGRK